jgi:predicted ribosomally synthesized peptide with SipW-like signal peptide
MNKKTLWGGVALGTTALGLVGGGTFAAWSDFSVQSEEIAAGHLTLDMGTSYEVGSEPLDLAPGINRYRAFYIASNDGDSVPNGNLSVTLRNLVDSENGCENNGEADAEAPTRTAHAGADALDTDGITAGARCLSGSDAGEASDLVSLQWRWTEPLPASTDCDSLNTYANEHTPGPSPFVNAAPSGAIGGLEGFTTPIETLQPGQGLCVLMTINTFDHPSRPWHMNALQGDSLDFDVRFDLVQAP